MRYVQKIRTWDFAAKTVVRKTMVDLGKMSQREFGVMTKRDIITLGPTFIKLGQAVSVRSDIFPVEFTKEFESLQDQVPPMSAEYVCDVLGKDRSIFKDFSVEPYKSASLGQVHKARLQDGTQVVVKVQREGIQTIIENDIKNISDVLYFLDTFGISTGPSARDVFIESTQYIYEEIDYRHECANAERFRKNFENVPWLIVPKMYKDLSSDKLLVMEFVPSTKIADSPIQKKMLCEALISSFIAQVMEHGFFHGDPHPGNLGISNDGRLVVYDFGLVVPLPKELTDGMKNMLTAIIQRDTKKIVDILTELGIIIPTSERDDIELFFDSLIGYLEGKGMVAENDIVEILAREKPFRLPSSFIFLARAFSLLDGQCRQLDPDFTFAKYIEPMVRKEVTNSIDIGKMAVVAMEMPTRIRSMSSSILAMEKSRGSMRRSLEKNYDAISILQMTVLVNMTTLYCLDMGYKPVGLVGIMVTFGLLMKARRK
jgi:ubiquinone biosynthesis protein